MKARGLIFAVGVILVGLTATLVAQQRDQSLSRLTFAASRLQSEIGIEGIECVSIAAGKVVFDRKEYWDPQLNDAISTRLSIKSVLLDADYAACPWGCFETVVPGEITAVRHHERPAQYLISIGICQRRTDGSMNPSKCVTKNVYVFDATVEPSQLFRLGLAGLAKPQAK
ncbi:hypothetical protein ABH975_002359 [Bradyrhizobium ottawaense]|uniref:hypothetical protein n=1 Tax=Bradyrhizobium ottawaense TaxID=931866 RepID=UPI0035151B2A